MSTMQKDTGRIFRVAAEGARGKSGFDLAKLSDRELVEMQAHRNDWYVRRARVLLHQRAVEDRCLRRMSMLYYGINSSPVPIRANSVLCGPYT